MRSITCRLKCSQLSIRLCFRTRSFLLKNLSAHVEARATAVKDTKCQVTSCYSVRHRGELWGARFPRNLCLVIQYVLRVGDIRRGIRASRSPLRPTRPELCRRGDVSARQQHQLPMCVRSSVILFQSDGSDAQVSIRKSSYDRQNHIS
jgi:hypothetical protein